MNDKWYDDEKYFINLTKETLRILKLKKKKTKGIKEKQEFRDTVISAINPCKKKLKQHKKAYKKMKKREKTRGHTF